MTTGSAPVDDGLDPHATVASVVADAAHQLTHAGVSSPRFDAEVLLAHALDIERSGLAYLIVMGSRIDAEQRAAFNALVERRCEREPLQHITGIASFRRIDLRVGPGVFVPRPETELVAGHVIEWLSLADATPVPTVVDLCAGSGAIALSVATEVPTADVWAVELDPDAVVWLQRNVEELGLRERVSVVDADARTLSQREPSLVGRCDAVVTNPPYVPDDATIRDPEAARHDPAAALWGGPDGLDVVRGLEREAAWLLRPYGLFVLEHADVQGESLPALLRESVTDGQPTWVDVADHIDLNDRPRYTVARRSAAVKGEAS